MASMISGPIAAHSGYGSGGGGDEWDVGQPAPRVRSNAAKNIATMHQGSIGYMFGVQGKAIGPSTWKKDPIPKDHFSENYKRMRRIQRATKQKEKEQSKPMKALWKSDKFSTVTSKVRDNIEKEPLAPRPASANYLRAHSRAGNIDLTKDHPPRPHSSHTRCYSHEKKPTVPRPQSSADVHNRSHSSLDDVELIRHDLDFIKINGHSAKYAQMKRAPSMTALDDLKKKKDDELNDYHEKKKGKVPSYLLKRQHKWKQEEINKVRNMPDPEMPPGHKVMANEERVKTLHMLQKSQKEYMNRLQALPIRTDTLRVRTCKQEIEKKLSEIEEAIKIFSRSKVFIKVDE